MFTVKCKLPCQVGRRCGTHPTLVLPLVWCQHARSGKRPGFGTLRGVSGLELDNLRGLNDGPVFRLELLASNQSPKAGRRPGRLPPYKAGPLV